MFCEQLQVVRVENLFAIWKEKFGNRIRKREGTELLRAKTIARCLYLHFTAWRAWIKRYHSY
jgi:hypothetical protein